MNALPHKPRMAFRESPTSLHKDPYNIISTDRVKCLNCGDYVLIQKLHQHLSYHAQPQTKSMFRQAPNNPPMQTPHRSGSYLFVNRDYNYIEPIDVRTMQIKVLPQQQQRKRDVSLPKHQPIRLKSSQPLPLVQIEQAPHQQSTIQSLTRSWSLMAKQKLVKDDYFESVKLNLQPKKLSIQKRPVSCLKNIRHAECQDQFVDPSKPVVNQSRARSLQKYTYSITTGDNQGERSQRDSISISNSRITVVPASPNILAVQTPVKVLSTSRIFSTAPTNQYHGSSVCQPGRRQSQMQRFNCRQCGGFYCHYCKSTVPPEFRRSLGSRVDHQRNDIGLESIPEKEENITLFSFIRKEVQTPE